MRVLGAATKLDRQRQGDNKRLFISGKRDYHHAFSLFSPLSVDSNNPGRQNMHLQLPLSFQLAILRTGVCPHRALVMTPALYYVQFAPRLLPCCPLLINDMFIVLM